jgi:murein DD-endopeptidase MepM/ murein hydrolase activator NlpD
MSTSLRFRPRQGGKKVESSLVRRWQSTMDVWSQRIQSLSSRHPTHLVVVVIAILAFTANLPNLHLDRQLSFQPTPTLVPRLGFRASQESPSGRGGPREGIDPPITPTAQSAIRPPLARPSSLTTSDLLRAPVVHTIIPERLRRDIITYQVQKGDNLFKIALQFNLEQETIMWANGNLEQNPDLIRPGQELIILPIDGVYHTVVKGDTLKKIADKYKANVEHIIECPYNKLDPENPQIAPGDKIIVPGGVKPYISREVTAYNGPIPKNAERGSGMFAWPTSGRLTDRFAFNTFSGRWHGGLDISGYLSAPVYASDSGFVTFAGWTKTGYGNLLIIDHGNGFETRYAHLQAFYVSAGQSVGKGDLIAAMGSTGNSTGPHLHFEIRYKGVRKNPELYLP